MNKISKTKKKKISDSNVEEYEIKLKKITNDFKEEKNKLIRNIAELQNQLKRYEKDYIIEKNKIKKKYLLNILDILKLIKKAHKDKNSNNGIKLIIDNIEDMLKKEKIQYIECIGKKFNHNIHHAISTIDKQDCKDNVIVEEIKKGYYLDDDILRPSQVIVQKKID